MNSDEIECYLRRRLRDFDGVFSVDNMPEDPRLLVCNTDPSDKPGHRPNADFERYMNRHCVSWNLNDKPLQSVVSKFCGYYCIFFCILRSRGVDMCKIVRSFSSDTELNDALVHAYVCRLH